MGVHKRQREMENMQDNYIKKSSCYLFVVMALLAGLFIGNTITMLYLGQQRSIPQNISAPVTQQQDDTHVADPNALAQLEGKAASNPTDSNAWIQLGNFCFDHNLPEKAIEAYERALELKPMNIGVWSDLGVMYRRTKQFDKAVDAFGHAADLDPQHVVSRFNMGIVYLHDLNDKVGAMNAWKQVLAIDPEAKTPNGKPVADLLRELDKK